MSHGPSFVRPGSPYARVESVRPVESRAPTPIDDVAIDTLMQCTRQSIEPASLEGRVSRFSQLDVSRPRLKGWSRVLQEFFYAVKKLLTGEGLHEKVLRDRMKELVREHKAGCAMTLALMPSEEVELIFYDIIVQAMQQGRSEDDDGKPIMAQKDIRSLVHALVDEMKNNLPSVQVSRNQVSSLDTPEKVLCYLAQEHREQRIDLRNIFTPATPDSDNGDYYKFLGILMDSKLPMSTCVELLDRMGLLSQRSAIEILGQSAYNNPVDELVTLMQIEKTLGFLPFSLMKARFEHILTDKALSLDDPTGATAGDFELQANELEETGRLNENRFLRMAVKATGYDIDHGDLQDRIDGLAGVPRVALLGGIFYYDELINMPSITPQIREVIQAIIFTSIAGIRSLDGSTFIDPMGESVGVAEVLDDAPFDRRVAAAPDIGGALSVEEYLQPVLQRAAILQDELNMARSRAEGFDEDSSTGSHETPVLPFTARSKEEIKQDLVQVKAHAVVMFYKYHMHSIDPSNY